MIVATRFWSLAAAVVLALSGCAACDDSTSREEPRSIVVGRVGAAGVAAEPTIRTAGLRLGQELRNAFRVQPGEPLKVVVDTPANQMLLSIGVRGRVRSSTPVRFVVRARTPDGWQTVFSRSVADTEKWHDQLVDARALDPGAREFEFDVDLEGANEELSYHFGSVTFSGAATGTDRARPHIVLVSLDTLGAAYLGSEGELEGVSPAIDEVLRRSAAFSRAFVQFGSTYLSHQSLFTGRYPSVANFSEGIRAIRGKWSRSRLSLVDRLASDGYLTVAITENGYVASTFGFSKGFDWYDNGPKQKKGVRKFAGYAARTFSDTADTMERLQRVAPLFVFVHTYQVHSPYDPRSAAGQQIAARLSPGDTRSYGNVSQVAKSPGYRPDARDVRRMRALYIGGIRDLDAEVEKFFSRLAGFETAGETLVVLTSDHGEMFRGLGRHGGLDNDVLRVPLGFYWPSRISAREYTAPVELIDVFPTILDFAGVPAVEGVDGRSLSPLLLTGKDPRDVPRAAFSLSKGAGYAIQTERFKLRRPVRGGSARIYDLERDPGETRDVSAEHPEQAALLLGLLEARTRALDGSPLPLGEELEIDSQTFERLQALGYVE